MKKEKTKVYIYTRVSTTMQIDGYSLDAQNGQWLKSIKFKLPIIAEDMSLSLDNDTHVETVCTLSQSGTLKKILARSKQWI